ncbi:efflux RND transporter periplasmic adaptor subunit [Thiorhodococcus mannitoliphagus]|uniref:Efflux RND transporter periplasmic adaptor subunit n=1 Tax=Thiorhodococcus mannitoliphagus TaxID=329406 RepID=A0A6P1E3F2_9GAMM|nr:efflux RND transporter periplasmic adaptor subunit [Thiorhodococcus mannitoliphagus]NEX22554.1 efflux RND transporter periplasmic adaptor subunit [Thiorhodococcus mannitoliphagus]
MNRAALITATRPTLGVLALLLPLTASAADLITLDAEQQRAFGIDLIAPLAAEARLSRRYPAEVAVPNRQLRVVAAPQGGVLETLRVAEGEQVAAGQVIAELRSPDLVDTQSQYLESLIRLELAESELARDRKLHQEGIIAERRLLQSQSKQRELATLVEQRHQLLELAGLDAADIETLTRTRRLTSTLPIHAPIAGVVLEQMVSTGQSMTAADPLYRIGELDPLWLEIHVPVGQLGGLAVGNQVFLTRQGTAGKIITIGRMVHGRDQGVLVRAEIHEGSRELRPGQFVEVQLMAALEEGANAGETAQGWRLPSSALVRDGEATYIFIAREGGFAAEPVTVVGEEEQSVVVNGALVAADQVAISGVVALKAAWLGGE